MGMWGGLGVGVGARTCEHALSDCMYKHKLFHVTQEAGHYSLHCTALHSCGFIFPTHLTVCILSLMTQIGQKTLNNY